MKISVVMQRKFFFHCTLCFKSSSTLLFQITADNVVCSHGASVTDLDENSMFYLSARGISRPVRVYMASICICTVNRQSLDLDFCVWACACECLHVLVYALTCTGSIGECIVDE